MYISHLGKKNLRKDLFYTFHYSYIVKIYQYFHKIKKNPLFIVCSFIFVVNQNTWKYLVDNTEAHFWESWGRPAFREKIKQTILFKHPKKMINPFPRISGFASTDILSNCRFQKTWKKYKPWKHNTNKKGYHCITDIMLIDRYRVGIPCCLRSLLPCHRRLKWALAVHPIFNHVVVLRNYLSTLTNNRSKDFSVWLISV